MSATHTVDVLHEGIQKAFQEVLDDENFTISDDMVLKEIPNWDSLNYVKLIVALESEFDITFTTDEVADMASVRDFKEVLVQKRRGVS